MTTESPDLLDRLRAANIAVGDDPAPAWEHTRRRITASPRRSRRLLLAGGAAAAIAVTASFVVTSREDSPRPLGVLEAAAATAASNPQSARFSGYTAETRVEIGAFEDTTWQIVRPVSSTEFEGRLESVRPVPKSATPRVFPPVAPIDGVERSSQREGDQMRDVMRWRQPYGTMFQGTPNFFEPGSTERPVTVPTDPDEAAAAVAAWAEGRVPAGAHPQLARLIREAGRSPIAETLLYAENVLTAPRVSPDVRAAVYRALSRVPDVRVDPTATDALGRPAAALIATDDDGPTNTRTELLIDPETSRVLGERHVFTVDPGANERRPADEPPYGEGSEETTYRYAD
ncbi:hypothetical protein DVA67_007380 [Solirubrobacter sp. CPCC 204708]|uniref:CU044_5270 family protein n=1 Tax=Solirubrobacter deserti TaxID=2282478 RepID=A0ABT4RK07_9ACTN|nr:hypothetical protein [Solirubrobacter deserti]MBE2315792.1 hypothetical protein [Solirubrobacter deserti]MDA0138871.1 hypothetical protein [Solirubrobacter deserti]